MMRFLLTLFVFATALGAGLLTPPSVARAAEISTNGTGGGLWSDPASWRGNKVPVDVDEVVIRKFDVISFDQDHSGKTSCKKLQIDPRGVFQFKTGAGKAVCVVQGPIESFGIIKIDGTRSATDHFELRLTGVTPKEREIKLGKGASFLLYGRPKLPDGKKNVVLHAQTALDDKKAEIVATVDADSQVALDWQNAQIHDVKLSVKSLDNTGAKNNERIQVLDCKFLNQARLLCHTCDTPILSRNTFDYAGKEPIVEPAISVLYSPLAEIKGNTIRGKFARGIAVNYQTDSSVVGNTVEGCEIGIQGGYGIPNTMVKDATIKNCDTGIKLEGASGVVEEVTIQGAKLAIHVENANLQITSVTIKDLDPKGIAFQQQGGKSSLLNCAIKPEQIKFVPPATPQKTDLVEAHQYLIVGCAKAPEGSLIDVRTVAPALVKDAADPNVRNSPAPLPKGKTPPPRALNTLMVKAWSIDPAGKPVPGPEYQIAVMGPAAKEGDVRPILKTMPYRPAMNAVRPDLDDDTPTLEVPAK